MVDTSGGPSKRIISEGLRGAASTRTSTSSHAGSGTTTSSSRSASVPLDVIVERSSRPFRPTKSVINQSSISNTLAVLRGQPSNDAHEPRDINPPPRDKPLDPQRIFAYGARIACRGGAAAYWCSDPH